MGRTEKELADQIAKRLQLPIRTGREFMKLLLEFVREDLRKTGRSELRGLGTFAVHDRPARDTVHPKSGKPVHISARKAIRYRASKELKELINPAPPPAPAPSPPEPSPKKGRKRAARGVAQDTLASGSLETPEDSIGHDGLETVDL
jgi:integration host factor subunit beta